jgi:hypothetical protein
MIVSGGVHRHQLIVIEFLQAENRLLKELWSAIIQSGRFGEVGEPRSTWTIQSWRLAWK